LEADLRAAARQLRQRVRAARDAPALRADRALDGPLRSLRLDHLDVDPVVAAGGAHAEVARAVDGDRDGDWLHGEAPEECDVVSQSGLWQACDTVSRAATAQRVPRDEARRRIVAATGRLLRTRRF